MNLLTRPTLRPRADAPTAGPARFEDASTILDVFRTQATRLGDRPALRHRTDRGWEALTWRAYAERVEALAAGLVEMGVRPGDRVGLLSANRLEWHLADLAIMSAGAVSVPIYFTAAAPQVRYMLEHSGATVCFVGGHDQLGKVLTGDEAPDQLEHLVLFEADHRVTDDSIMTLDELEALGAERRHDLAGELAERRRTTGPSDLATLVYTSGTTGAPKGTMLTHGNLLWTLQSVTQVVPIDQDDRFLSYLPLSHVAERVVSHFGQIASGGETWFARSIATLAEDLQECRPTIFLGVPRVWQKFHDGVLEAISDQPAVVQRSFDELVRLGLERVAEEQGEAEMSPVRRAELVVLDRVVGHRIRSQLGLDKARVLVTAAAPIHPSLLRFFHAIGLPVIEVYGQTEGSGPTTITRLGQVRIGSVGPAIPGVELSIADDGEILVRGGNVCAGYFGDVTATEALIDDDGFMHSGDAGRIDADGHLWITGRVKDLIITASGKNITPSEIETRLEVEPLVSHAVVVGEGRPFLTALVTLDAEALAAWATEHGLAGDVETLVNDPDVVAEVQRSVDTVNAEHARVEGIKRFRILPHELTIADGELTPTLKVKRGAVTERYGEVIAELYGEPAPR